jgi:hypothetical protein
MVILSYRIASLIELYEKNGSTNCTCICASVVHDALTIFDLAKMSSLCQSGKYKHIRLVRSVSLKMNP